MNYEEQLREAEEREKRYDREGFAVNMVAIAFAAVLIAALLWIL